MSFLGRILKKLFAPLKALLKSPGSIFSLGGKLLNISLPGRVAALVFLFLLICLITVVLTQIYTADSVDPELIRQKLPIGLGLIVVISFVLYFLAKLLLEGNVSHFPEIDDAWEAGIEALADEDLEITDLPLFLILGSSGDGQEKALLKAAKTELCVRNVPPDARAPLHWYADEKAIFLFLTDTSCLSRVAGLASQAAGKGRAGLSHTELGTGAGRETTGTIVTRIPRALVSSVAASVSAPMKSVAAVFRSLVAGSGVSSGPVGKHPVVSLSSRDWKQIAQQLEHVCGLIYRARRPICPVNGVLTLLPYPLLRRRVTEENLIEQAVQRDLQTLHESLRICCPVTALVGEMEAEQGFFELLRRMGRGKTSGRFGKSFSVGNAPTASRLKATNTHACGMFEDWVYKLFREAEGSTQVGNRRLFSLLCALRHDVQPRLASVLARGYAVEPNDDVQARNALFFSGCYFAATGENEDHQAFVQGLFRKLLDEQDELEWTNDALRKDDRNRTLAYFVWAVDVVLALGLLAYFFDLLPLP